MATIKVSELEALLKFPHEMDVNLYGIGYDFMEEVARVYGDGEVTEVTGGYYYSFKAGDVDVTLFTKTYKNKNYGF